MTLLEQVQNLIADAAAVNVLELTEFDLPIFEGIIKDAPDGAIGNRQYGVINGDRFPFRLVNWVDVRADMVDYDAVMNASCDAIQGDESVYDGPQCEEFYEDRYEDDLSDAEADAMTFASCGWGTDEDYGYFGGDEFE